MTKKTRAEYLDSLQQRMDERWDNERAKLSPEERETDVPDEPDYTEEEEFKNCYDAGMKPDQFADKEEGERYRRWLEMLNRLPS